jgi:hypothetical protein
MNTALTDVWPLAASLPFFALGAAMLLLALRYYRDARGRDLYWRWRHSQEREGKP